MKKIRTNINFSKCPTLQVNRVIKSTSNPTSIKRSGSQMSESVMARHGAFIFHPLIVRQWKCSRNQAQSNNRHASTSVIVIKESTPLCAQLNAPTIILSAPPLQSLVCLSKTPCWCMSRVSARLPSSPEPILSQPDVFPNYRGASRPHHTPHHNSRTRRSLSPNRPHILNPKASIWNSTPFCFPNRLHWF